MNKTHSNETPSPAFEPLLDEREAAHFLGVADGTPGNWRRANPPKGPAFVVVGGVIRYAPSDLRAYIAERRRDPREMAA